MGAMGSDGADLRGLGMGVNPHSASPLHRGISYQLEDVAAAGRRGTIRDPHAKGCPMTAPARLLGEDCCGGWAPAAGSDTGALLSRGAPVPGSDSLGATQHISTQKHQAGMQRTPVGTTSTDAQLGTPCPGGPADAFRLSVAGPSGRVGNVLLVRTPAERSKQPRWDSRGLGWRETDPPVTCAPLPREH